MWGNVCCTHLLRWKAVLSRRCQLIHCGERFIQRVRVIYPPLNNMFTCREECMWFALSVMALSVLPVEKGSSLRSHFQCSISTVWKISLHLCPTSILLPHLFCPEGSLFLSVSISHVIQAGAASVVCRVHAIAVCQTSCAGKWSGFVWARMDSADNYWIAFDNNCIGL